MTAWKNKTIDKPGFIFSVVLDRLQWPLYSATWPWQITGMDPDLGMLIADSLKSVGI